MSFSFFQKGQRPPNAKKYTATFYKPETGEIDGKEKPRETALCHSYLICWLIRLDVVQGRPEHKKKNPDEYHLWDFEVVLADGDEPGVEGVPR